MPKPKAITRLDQLLEEMEVRFRWYDAGQRIRKLKREQWQRFESGESPYPHPHLRQAWLGLAFWPEDDKHQQQVQLWCLRFPLDEQGKLDLASRDQFLTHLLTAMGSNVAAAKSGERLNAVLEDNPFVFKATPDKQASLHAIVSQSLKKPPSQFYAPTVRYIENPEGDDWQQLGIQGLADVACRWQEHQALLAERIQHLAEPVMLSLCQCLEHHAISTNIAQEILKRLEQSNEASSQAAMFRGLSQCKDNKPVHQALRSLLSHPNSSNVEVLATLCSRAGPMLLEEEFCQVFLEHLASAGQDVFNGLVSELLFQPGLRASLLNAIRAPERSATLDAAIGGLFGPQ